MSLALRHLALSHFRSHLRARLEVGPQPVALFGPNGAGKTNLLEAVSLFSPGRGMRRAPARDMARRPESLGWQVSGRVEQGAQQHELVFTSQEGAPRSIRCNDKPATQEDLGRIARVLWLVPAMDRLWIEAAEGRRRFLDRMTLSFFPGHGSAVLRHEKAMRDRNRLLKDGVRDAAWYAALEAQMADSAQVIAQNRAAALHRIAQAQQDAATAFPAADLALIHPDMPMPEDPADHAHALAAARAGDMAAGRTRMGPHRVDLAAHYTARDCPAADCSTGEQKALLISLILANARALSQDLGHAPILLLDEVAAHLDPNRRAALFDEICELGAQAWMTGTERALFAHLGARGQYFAVDFSPDGSAIQPVT